VSFNTIPAALIAKYRAGAFFTDARTLYANEAFSPTKPKPPTTAAWASVFVIPAQTAALSLSDSDEMAGVFQIDLNYPLNGGAGAAQVMADQIRTHFKRGTRAGDVELGTASYAPLGPVDGWYRGVVSVEYRAMVAV
jgi:hypothetical protein